MTTDPCLPCQLGKHCRGKHCSGTCCRRAWMEKKRGGNEQATVLAILTFLRLHHIPRWHIRTGATKIGGRFIRFGEVGMADIIAAQPWCGIDNMPAERDHRPDCLVARFVAIEAKAATGRVTPAQQAFLDQVNAAGGRAFVARSVADVARELGLG